MASDRQLYVSYCQKCQDLNMEPDTFAVFKKNVLAIPEKETPKTPTVYNRRNPLTPEQVKLKNAEADKKIKRNPKEIVVSAYRAGVKDVVWAIEQLKDKVGDIQELLDVFTLEAEELQMGDVFEEKELFQMIEKING